MSDSDEGALPVGVLGGDSSLSATCFTSAGTSNMRSRYKLHIKVCVREHEGTGTSSFLSPGLFWKEDMPLFTQYQS